MSTAAGAADHAFVTVDIGTGPVQIEVARIEPAGAASSPLIVFLHEGLGSVSMWRDFPTILCQRLACRGLVYSRPGYGRSTPCSRDQIWSPDYMHEAALQSLPAVLRAVGVHPEREAVWLLGHSDGGSIALIHAAHASHGLAGAILLAPHIMVEDLTLRSIEQAREAFEQGSLAASLARHHLDAQATFMRWNRTWLSAAFRSWSVEEEITAIRCPLLAVQGIQDPYGSLEQVFGIARRVPGTRVVEIDHCGHSPHRDQPDRLIAEVAAFMGV